MLNSWVLVCGYSSPESGLGLSMSVATVYGTDLAIGAVLGPLGDRVREVLADHALEGLAVPRPVQATEHVVQRPVLEQDHDHVVQRVIPALTRHPGLLIFSTWAPLLAREPPYPRPVFLAHHGQCRQVAPPDDPSAKGDPRWGSGHPALGRRRCRGFAVPSGAAVFGDGCPQGAALVWGLPRRAGPLCDGFGLRAAGPARLGVGWAGRLPRVCWFPCPGCRWQSPQSRRASRNPPVTGLVASRDPPPEPRPQADV